MTKIGAAIFWFSIICFVALIYAASLLEVPGWLVSNNAPAWVQAIGSVAAILATGWGVLQAHELEIKRTKVAEAAASAAFVELVCQLVYGASQVAKKIAGFESLPRRSDFMMMKAEIESLSAAIEKIDINKTNKFQTIEMIVSAGSVLRRLAHMLSLFQQMEPTPFANVEWKLITQASSEMHEQLWGKVSGHFALDKP